MKQRNIFRVFWNINSILIFLICILLLLMIVTSQLSNSFNVKQYQYGKGDIAGINKDETEVLNSGTKYLVYDTPAEIPVSGYYYSPVRIIKPETDALGTANIDLLGGVVNIIFFNKNEAYTLLEEFGFISYINVLSDNPDYKNSRSLLKEYILYKIAISDSNQDGLINGEDNEAFYISDNRGKNLKQITPGNLDLNIVKDINYKDNIIFFEEVKSFDKKGGNRFTLKSRRIYSYDFSTLRFSKLDQLEKVFRGLQEFYLNQ